MEYTGPQYNQWRVVDRPPGKQQNITWWRAGLAVTWYRQLRIDLPADDPRHFQIGCVITPRAIIGV